MSRLKKLRLIEFSVIGVVMGVTEDLIAVTSATGEKINLRILLIVFLVALPFAIISELVVDHPRFWEKIWPTKEILPQKGEQKQAQKNSKNPPIK